MPESNETCKILIVDNDVEYAKQIAYELEQIRPDLLNNQPLNIEISNTAYFVAKQIESCVGDKPPWDIILSDVYMPIPSSPLEREVAEEIADSREISYKNYKWKFWNYNYTWNSHLEGTPDHGGIYLANKIQNLKSVKNDLNNLKVILISDKLIDPNLRKEVIELLISEKSWLNFYDKAQWDEGIEDWPERLNNPSIFRWAIIHAINERNSEFWGDSLDMNDESLPALSKKMKEIIIKGKTLANTLSIDRILITGERGIGKSHIARNMHDQRMIASGEKGDFVCVECTSISENLFVGELFGHIKGSFTGAVDDKQGFVEEARNGTLFFDEIGDLSPANQGKLLRLLQDNQFVKLGSTKSENLEAELVIFATNRDLDKLKEDGYFRSDLYDRIKKSKLEIPSLKDRIDEIIPFAEYFLEKFNNNLSLSQEAKQLLIEQSWDGNVRQLKNTIEEAATFCTSSELKISDFPKMIQKNPGKLDSVSLPYNNDQNGIDITPENILAGQIKWAQIQKESHDKLRYATMIVVKSMWEGPQKELAKFLNVNQNTLEKFFSQLKGKIRSGKLHSDDLKPYLPADHYSILENYFM